VVQCRFRRRPPRQHEMVIGPRPAGRRTRRRRPLALASRRT
jgi:hypothetical protein